jgi:hypothetical protein
VAQAALQVGGLKLQQPARVEGDLGQHPPGSRLCHSSRRRRAACAGARRPARARGTAPCTTRRGTGWWCLAAAPRRSAASTTCTAWTWRAGAGPRWRRKVRAGRLPRQPGMHACKAGLWFKHAASWLAAAAAAAPSAADTIPNLNRCLAQGAGGGRGVLLGGPHAGLWWVARGPRHLPHLPPLPAGQSSCSQARPNLAADSPRCCCAQAATPPAGAPTTSSCWTCKPATGPSRSPPAPRPRRARAPPSAWPTAAS